MEIEKVRIENFRCFNDEEIHFSNYTSIIGPNGSGKSTVFLALNVFFREFGDIQSDLSNLSADDFHHNDTTRDIKVTVTFRDLSEEAKNDFSAYVRQEKLIISAVASFNPATGKADVKQFGNRLVIEEFRSFFEAEKQRASVAELRELYSELRSSYPDLPEVRTKGDMEKSLNQFEESHPELCSLAPSEDQFYGISRGANKLQTYLQWIYIPAIKDATTETEESSKSALGKLLARTVRSQVSFDENLSELEEFTRRRYQELLESKQGILKDISRSLEDRLAKWAHPGITANVAWKQEPGKSVKIEEPHASLRIGERGFESDLSRFGHGLQRSYLLALLQELSTYDAENVPKLVMAIEEPELFQHPPQAKHMSEILLELSESSSQIMVCTHSPKFIPGDRFDKIRLARETGHPSFTAIKQLTYHKLAQLLTSVNNKLITEEGIVAKLYPTLNPLTNEMFFCKKLILVEGHEDLAYIQSYIFLNGKKNSIREGGVHMIPMGGKDKMIRPLAIAKLLEIPTMVIFDLDTDKEELPDGQRREYEIRINRGDNRSILDLMDYNSENEWPESNDIVKSNLIGWNTSLTHKIASELGDSITPAKDEAAEYYGQTAGLRKNPLFIAKTMEIAWSNGVRSQILSDLSESIERFAQA